MKIVKLLINSIISCCFLYNPLFSQNFTSEVRDYIVDSASTTVINDVKVIDGTGAPSKVHQSVIITNGIITFIGKLNESIIAIPKDSKIIDGAGKTLIPGLVMMHEHFYYTTFLDTYFNVQEMPYSFPRMYLAGGSTTIRTAGSIEPQTDLAIHRMIGEGKLIGPEMDVTAPYIERPGFDIPSMNMVKDAAEAGNLVKYWAEKGCTSFKMYMHVTKEDMEAVVKEAHLRNLKVTGHLCTLTYRQAATLGIDNLEHGFYASTDFDPNKKEGEFDYPASQKGLQALPVNSDKMKNLIEFLVEHKVDEVIVSNGENQLAKPVLAELRKICRQKEIELTFLPQLFHSTFRQVADLNIEELQQAPTFPISSYFQVKRVLDFVFALLFTVLLSPVFICVSVLVALDVGPPLLFWQRRWGQGGRGFQVYKFRTMQSPFDRLGESLPEKRRLSAIGHVLRRTGLDELPQLLNVLVGEMSLVGPRPLLPEDQPADPTIRLMVRPGITGWAQVNGGKQITSEEKDDRDEWYIRNASPLLDLRILLLTCRYVFVGNRADAPPGANAKLGVGGKTLNDAA